MCNFGQRNGRGASLLISKSGSGIQSCQKSIEEKFALVDKDGKSNKFARHSGVQNESKERADARYKAGIDSVHHQDMDSRVGSSEARTVSGKHGA